MSDTPRPGALRACAAGLLLLSAATAASANPIGPEAVHDLLADPGERVELTLIDADGTSPLPRRTAADYPRATHVVFACWSLSQRRCRDEALRLQGARHDRAYYLTGTPREWVASGLAMEGMSKERLATHLEALRTISVADLASARRDAAEFTLVDVRSGLRPEAARIEGAIEMPPVVVGEKKAMLPKHGWIVLYDGGDGAAEASAAELRAAGYPMAVALAGGYPAWVTSEQR